MAFASRIVAALAGLVTLAVTLAVAIAAAPARSDGLFAHLIDDAYLARDPEGAGALIATVGEARVVGLLPTVGAFLAEYFRAEPDRVEAWIAPVPRFDPAPRETIALALWLAGRTELIPRIWSGPSLMDFADRPPRLATEPAGSPGELDMQWAAFFARGNPDYVRRIVDALAVDRSPRGAPAHARMVRDGAEWSLRNAVLEHEAVARILRAEAAIRPDPERSILERILAEARAAHRPFPTADGDFSARLLLSDEAPAGTAADPPGATDAPEATTSGRNRIRVVTVQFTGQELSETLESRVTWDLRVTDPRGRPWADADRRTLDGLIGRTTARFRAYPAKEVRALRFTDRDEPGLYRLTAEVRDEIGGRRVTLEATVAHVE